jgi:hypothetical protein
MRQLRWLTLLWPGWPQLWFAGAWSGLAIALGFAALLDLGLLASRMWTELFSPATRTAIWLMLAAIWTVSAAASWRWVGGLQIGRFRPADNELFLQAREEYLKGNWFEAETALGRLLDRNVLDSEARLMRAALLARTARRKEATGELDRLTRMDGSEHWRMEIARLRSRLAEMGSTRTAERSKNEGGGEIAGSEMGTVDSGSVEAVAAEAAQAECSVPAATVSKAA